MLISKGKNRTGSKKIQNFPPAAGQQSVININLLVQRRHIKKDNYLGAGGASEKRRRPPPEAKIFGGVFKKKRTLREKVKKKHWNIH